MQRDVTLTPNQEKFLSLHLQGVSLTEAAKQCDINRVTAYRWLANPVIQAEVARRQSSIREAEQTAIEQVVTVRYAVIENRVASLDRLAKKLEAYLEDESKIWLLDVKTVGFGESAERVDLVRFNADLIKEYRATFDDLAKELGQRVKKQEIEHSGLVELLNAEHASLLGDLEALPDASPAQKQTETSDPGAHSVPSS